MAERPHQQPHPDPAQGYEISDANPRAILLFGLGLVIVGIIVHVLVIGVYMLFYRQDRAAQPRLSILVQKESPKLPQDIDAIPSPRLVKDDIRALEQLYKQQQGQLKGYSWVDQKAGIVQIPITQAMQILVQQEDAARKQHSKVHGNQDK